MAKIYTKTGDSGTTGLADGKRISKSDIRLEAYGTVDELNSQLGLAIEFLKVEKSDTENIKSLIVFLIQIQNQLFNLGSRLAVDSQDILAYLPPITNEMIQALEVQIDQMESQLVPLKEFILPGGSIPAAQLHVARTVCRRAERYCSQIPSEKLLEPLALPYINRLSDFLFVASRFTNSQLKKDEIKWRK